MTTIFTLQTKLECSVFCMLFNLKTPLRFRGQTEGKWRTHHCLANPESIYYHRMFFPPQTRWSAWFVQATVPAFLSSDKKISKARDSRTGFFPLNCRNTSHKSLVSPDLRLHPLVWSGTNSRSARRETILLIINFTECLWSCEDKKRNHYVMSDQCADVSGERFSRRTTPETAPSRHSEMEENPNINNNNITKWIHFLFRKGHTSFTATDWKRPHLLHYNWQKQATPSLWLSHTQTTPTSLQLTHTGHSSFTLTDTQTTPPSPQ